MYTQPRLASAQATVLLDFLRARYDDFVMHVIEEEPDEDGQATVDQIIERVHEIAVVA